MSNSLCGSDKANALLAIDEKIAKNNNASIVKQFYIESYGCQMNFSDSEIVASIMQQEGFKLTINYQEADIILINTCAIRDRAEQTIRKRLTEFNKLKKKHPQLMVGVLGCMAERLKQQLLEEEKVVDLVAGPDAYRDLPILVQEIARGHKAVNTFLSREETYADISPVRLDSNGITAFISIMRGCNNMCSFCIVPFTRGRERSRSPHSIVQEAADLFDQGYREIILLGQNVDSYLWNTQIATNKQKEIKNKEVANVNFAQLLDKIASLDPRLRVRFSTSHPKDITNDVLYTMKKYDNICKHIHLPVQSGNNRILQLMNRTYDNVWYIQKINAIWSILGKTCGLSSDMISGFCSETEEEHQDTLALMDYVKYDFSYMFYYSQRPSTLAARKYPDDIPLEVKKRRLNEIIKKQRIHSLLRNQEDIGKVHHVLVEGKSKKSDDFLQGRNSANKVIIFPKSSAKKGDYVYVKVQKCNSATLFGELCV